jgi:hypothetical protein
MITVAEPTDADALRVRHQFLIDPDLRLSAGDVVAQLQVQLRHAVVILDALVQDGFLRRTCDARYIRAHTGDSPCVSP